MIWEARGRTGNIVGANVYDHRTWLYPLSFDETWFADSYDDNVGFFDLYVRYCTD